MDDARLVHLSDEPWVQVEAAFAQRRGQSGFERKISNRQAFEAVPYRAVTTRDDKRATMFLGGMLAALLTVSLRWIVNTPNSNGQTNIAKHGDNRPSISTHA